MFKKIKPIFSMLFGSLGVGILNLIMQMILARQLGSNDFGSFSAAYSLVMLLAPIAGLGIQSSLLRIYGEYGYQANAGKITYIKYILFTSFISLTLVTSISYFYYAGSMTGELIRVLSVLIISQVFLSLVSTRYQLEEKFNKYSLVNFGYIFFRFSLLMILILILDEINALQVACVYIFVSVIYFFIFFKILNGFENNINLCGHDINDKGSDNNISLSNLFKISWLYGINGILYLSYYQSAIVIIDKLVSSEAAGLYGVAFIIISVSYILPSVIFQKYLLPKVHRWYFIQSEMLLVVYKSWTFYSLFMGVLVAFLVAVSSKFIVLNVFGDEYLGSLKYIYILAMCIPLKYASSCIGLLFNLEILIKYKLYVMGGVALVNVILNFYFMPEFGAMVAAYSVLISEALILIFFIIIAKKRLIGVYAKI